MNIRQSLSHLAPALRRVRGPLPRELEMILDHHAANPAAVIQSARDHELYNLWECLLYVENMTADGYYRESVIPAIIDYVKPLCDK